MSALIYTLCALTASLTAWLLLRGYRRTRFRLLLWSGLCFVGLAMNNVLLVLDRLIFPTEVDLLVPRLFTSLGAVLLLVAGLVLEHDT